MAAKALALTWPQVLAARQRAQRLHPQTAVTGGDPVTLLRAMGGAQAQDQAAGLLSAVLRAAPEAGLTVTTLEAARVEARVLVRTWAMRGTLHLLPAEDAAWLVPFLGPRLIKGSITRRAQEGFNEAQAAEAVKHIRAALAEHGPLTRAELREYLAQHGLPNQGQGTVHLIYRAALEGVCVNGPMRDGVETLALLAAWAPAARFQRRPEAEVLSGLAQMYLGAFGPAEPADLAAWGGITLGEARRGFAAIEAGLREVSVEGAPLWLLAEAAESLLAHARRGAVALLPRFDTYLMGYRQRTAMLPEAHKRRVLPGGGIIHPTLVVDGAVAGAWRWQRSKAGTVITIEPFEPLSTRVRRALPAAAATLERCLGAGPVTLSAA
jgi:hypothetical protein